MERKDGTEGRNGRTEQKDGTTGRNRRTERLDGTEEENKMWNGKRYEVEKQDTGRERRGGRNENINNGITNVRE